ncbi:MAG: GMC family oxidoreductase N-terminal domain-containing protein [Paracoccaceae bacterium]|nr:GMC family oxidoreductase N-terminal domain-containing protein [Paracoccaceae bacterium]
MPDARWDYIIVGAGSAGCVLANRLTADGRTTVLLIEAGGGDRHPHIWAPAGFVKTYNDPRFNWCFSTEPGPGIDGREIFFPRGKVLGGSSAINGHLYVRGQARDFDTWAQLGNRGWSYDDVLPYFRRSEDRSAGADAYRGAGGPQHVSDVHERHPICEAFIEGAAELGLPRNPDYNGAVQEGVAYYQRTIRNGRRASAASSFLRPVLGRANLTLITRALVTGLEMDGRRVTGLRYRRRGAEHSVSAGREVILSAGAIGSPHLMQISGIGPSDLLAEIGIPVRHDLAGVGEGLRDHYIARVVNRVSRPITLNERAHGMRLWWEIAKWSASGNGLLAFSPAHVGAFVRSRPDLDLPELQLVFTPASYTEGVVGELQRVPGMTAGFWQMRPESRGHVRARSADPAEPPRIQPNYLTEETDRQVAVAGIRWCRRLLATRALEPFRHSETSPGPDCETDDEILAHIRATGSTVFHAIGTCRMGADENAVVDDRLRVRGVPGLRVIDASIMPTMPSANTNAATLMVAEKGADMVLEDR